MNHASNSKTTPDQRINPLIFISLISFALFFVEGCDIFEHSQYMSPEFEKVFENEHAYYDTKIFQTQIGYQIVIPGSKTTLLTIDEIGNEIGRKSIMFDTSSTGWYQVIQTKTKNYLLFGTDFTNNQLIGVCINPNGEIVWQKNYKDFFQYYFISVAELLNDRILLSAYSYDEVNTLPAKYIFVSSVNGNILSSNDIGNNFIGSIQLLPNGNITGIKMKTDSLSKYYRNVFLVEYDAQLKFVKERKLFGYMKMVIVANIHIFTDTSFILFGLRTSTTNQDVLWACMMTDKGDLLWEREIHNVQTGIEYYYFTDSEIAGKSIGLTATNSESGMIFNVNVDGNIQASTEKKLRPMVSLCQRNIGGFIAVGFTYEYKLYVTTIPK